jgi:hypothetical protein
MKRGNGSAAESHKDGKQKGGKVFVGTTYQSKNNTLTQPLLLAHPLPSPVLISLSYTFSVVAISTERAVTTCKPGFSYALYIIIYSLNNVNYSNSIS